MLNRRFGNWREGQTIFFFLRWLKEKKNFLGNSNFQMADPFNIPNGQLENLFDEFLNEENERINREEVTSQPQPFIRPTQVIPISGTYTAAGNNLINGDFDYASPGFSLEDAQRTIRALRNNGAIGSSGGDLGVN